MALLGENGAGKSTLIKAPHRRVPRRSRAIWLEGRKYRRRIPLMPSNWVSARFTVRLTCCRTCRWRIICSRA
ncbi:hypothetical protein DMH17_04200 [Raoultella planticola]|nr:hypothetical protein [Raoultella planticola]